MSTTWMVRAGEGGYLFDEFKSKGLVAIGWSDLEDLSSIMSKDAIIDLLSRHYPDDSDGRRSHGAAMIWRFVKEIKAGDLVLTYHPSERKYLVGEVADGYKFNPRAVKGYPHSHQVKWTGSVLRDDLSVQAKNSLGAIQTLFALPADVAEEIRRVLKGEKAERPAPEEDVALETIEADTQARAREFIKDRIQGLSWDQMQDFVAGLLRAMGYKTRVSPKGADRGKDIVASPDGLALEQPRIKVEVKHRVRQTMGAPEIRSFLATLRDGDRGLYVSTGGFSNEAHYEAERAKIPVTLVDLDTLGSLLEQNYEKLDIETRTLVPLIRVYWPADLKPGYR